MTFKVDTQRTCFRPELIAQLPPRRTVCRTRMKLKGNRSKSVAAATLRNEHPISIAACLVCGESRFHSFCHCVICCNLLLVVHCSTLLHCQGQRRRHQPTHGTRAAGSSGAAATAATYRWSSEEDTGNLEASFSLGLCKDSFDHWSQHQSYQERSQKTDQA